MSIANIKVFISHATEDKAGFVRPLAECLREHCKVWYDEFSLPLGSSIFHNISAGLAECDYGVVVLSDAFFQKKWTQDEIAGLAAVDTPERPRIIPIWKGVTAEQVRRFSPILSDRLAINADDGVEAAIQRIVEFLSDSDQGGFSHAPAEQAHPEDKFKELGAQLDSHVAKVEMNRSPQGARKLYDLQTSLFCKAEGRIEQIALGNPKFQISWSSGEIRCLPFDIIWFNVTLPNEDVLRIESTRPRSDLRGMRLDLSVFRPKRDDHGNFTYPDHLEDYRFTPSLTEAGDVEWLSDDESKLTNEGVIDFSLNTLFNHLKRILDERMGG